MNRNLKTEYFAFALLLIAGCFIFSWKVLVPQYKTDKSQMLALTSEIESSRDKLDSLKGAQADLEELGDTVDKLLLSVPADTDMPNLITELEALAIKNEASLPSLQISDDTSAGSTIGIVFNIKGDFEKLSKFISSIENDIRYMNIKTFSVSSNDDDLTLSLEVDAYKRTSSSLSGQGSSTQLPAVPLE
ncbi:MAG: type 4a pilus biogenesis protein PilO [Patescibacteria group bacterium]|jgi:Tfp pilus assembly protein PilO